MDLPKATHYQLVLLEIVRRNPKSSGVEIRRILKEMGVETSTNVAFYRAVKRLILMGWVVATPHRKRGDNSKEHSITRTG